MDRDSRYFTRGNDQNHPKKKKCKRAKWLSEEALNSWEKKQSKGKAEKERYTQVNAEFQE